MDPVEGISQRLAGAAALPLPGLSAEDLSYILQNPLHGF